jgi:hypothetical protein
MCWTEPRAGRGLWVLIAGWISGEDPMYSEVMIACDALSNRGACGELL